MTKELDRLRLAMTKLNRLRSNVVATQNCSWSNTTYTLVAILEEAGYEAEGATREQMDEHLACYGGAGKTPRHIDDHPPLPQGVVAERDTRPTQGSVLIHEERWRQKDVEGFDAERDDAYVEGELLQAAGSYLLAGAGVQHLREGERLPVGQPEMWPWPFEWWKPSDDPIPSLVKAGALIAAEIDRLQRAQ